MTVQDVAKILKVTEQAVYKMIRERRGIGEKFYYIPGSGYRVDDKFVEEVKP